MILHPTLIAIMSQTQHKIITCKSLYPTASALEERMRASVSADTARIGSPGHPRNPIFVISRWINSLAEPIFFISLSIARYKVVKSRERSRPRLAIRQPAPPCPTLGVDNGGVQLDVYIVIFFFLCRSSSSEKYCAIDTRRYRATIKWNNVFSGRAVDGRRK